MSAGRAGIAHRRRAIVVGAGPRGRRWIDEIARSPAVVVSGIVDLDVDVAQTAAEHAGHGDAAVGPTLDAVLDRVDADFVVNTTSPPAHAAVTLRALDAGLPVLTEKPLADDLADAREIVAASERTGLLVMTSQNRRYDDNLRSFIAATHRIGPLEMLSARFRQAPRFGSYQEVMSHPLLVDMAIHHFDVARYILGADAVRVFCDEFSPTWSWFRHPASAVAHFEMTGGARFLYDGSWCADGIRSSWNGAWRATGPLGTATWDGESTIRCEVGETSEPIDTPRVATGREQVAGALGDFLYALEGEHVPMGECHDNLRSLEMTFGAIRSAETNSPVTVREGSGGGPS